jgi:hypothetical protein
MHTARRTMSTMVRSKRNTAMLIVTSLVFMMALTTSSQRTHNTLKPSSLLHYSSFHVPLLALETTLYWIWNQFVKYWILCSYCSFSHFKSHQRVLELKWSLACPFSFHKLVFIPLCLTNLHLKQSTGVRLYSLWMLPNSSLRVRSRYSTSRHL